MTYPDWAPERWRPSYSLRRTRIRIGMRAGLRSPEGFPRDFGLCSHFFGRCCLLACKTDMGLYANYASDSASAIEKHVFL